MIIGNYNTNQDLPRNFSWKEQGYEVGHTSIRSVIRRVGIVRRDYGGDLAPGWEARLCDAICRKVKLPGCGNTNNSENIRSIQVSDVMRFFKAVKAWYDKGGTPVDSELANARAVVCAECPLNVKIKGCGVCLSVAKRFFGDVASKTTKMDARLKGCSVCGCQNKVSVWVPHDIKTSSTQNWDDYPAECWVTTERESL